MSTEEPRRYLVAYDIPDDSRRNKIAKKLESYGDRVQYSVFVVDSRPAKLMRLRQDLTGLATLSQDSILICDLGPVASLNGRRFDFLGRQRRLTPHDVISF